MQDGEQAIRQLVTSWLEASKAGTPRKFQASWPTMSVINRRWSGADPASGQHTLRSPIQAHRWVIACDANRLAVVSEVVPRSRPDKRPARGPSDRGGRWPNDGCARRYVLYLSADTAEQPALAPGV